MKNKTPKRDMALKMMSRQERQFGVNLFDSWQWSDRARAIKKRTRQA